MSDDTLNLWDAYALQDCIKALTKERDYWKADSAAGWDKCEENRAKLAEAVKALDETRIVLAEHEPHPLPVLAKVLATIAKIKGEQP